MSLFRTYLRAQYDSGQVRCRSRCISGLRFRCQMNSSTIPSLRPNHFLRRSGLEVSPSSVSNTPLPTSIAALTSLPNASPPTTHTAPISAAALSTRRTAHSSPDTSAPRLTSAGTLTGHFEGKWDSGRERSGTRSETSRKSESTRSSAAADRSPLPVAIGDGGGPRNIWWLRAPVAEAVAITTTELGAKRSQSERANEFELLDHKLQLSNFFDGR